MCDTNLKPRLFPKKKNIKINYLQKKLKQKSQKLLAKKILQTDLAKYYNTVENFAFAIYNNI